MVTYENNSKREVMTVLPASSFKISRIAFGAWAIGGWMWGGADESDSLDALEAAIDLGMSSIDTAPVYGFGKSEELVGKAVLGKRDRVQIFTKFGLRWDITSGRLHSSTADKDGNPIAIHRIASRESIIEECNRSLSRLGTDYIDYYQIHWPDPETRVTETMEALVLLKEQGKIRAGGVCNYSLADLELASGAFPVSCNQVPYSMLERGIEDEVIPWCLAHEPKIIAYSPLQRGVLTGKVHPDFQFKDGDHRAGSKYFTDPVLSLVNDFITSSLQPLAECKQVTVAQVVLQWTLAQPGVCCVLAGARNRAQVKENFGALSVEISDTEMNEIQVSLTELQNKIKGATMVYS
jgi:aryl-alcohol dehydrogenase-like predicted oxidoreductase